MHETAQTLLVDGRTTQYPGLEGTHKGPEVQLPALHRTIPETPIMCLTALSNTS